MTARRASATVPRVLQLPLALFLLVASAAVPAWAQAPAPVEAAAPAPVVVPEPAPDAAKVDPSRLAEPEIPRSEPPDLAAGELNLGFTLFRTFIVLAMVVALAYLTLNVGLRKLLGIRPVLGTQVVQVLERVPLDQKRSLFVVEAAGEVLLIGGGDSTLSLISKLDRAEVEKAKLPVSGSAPVQLSPFLQKLLGKKDKPSPPAA